MDWLKGKILDSIDNYIRSKTTSSSKHQAPWITSKIRREIRKSTKLYSKAKNSNTNSNWENFKDQNRKTQSSMRKSYRHHIENNILGYKNEEDFGEHTEKNLETYEEGERGQDRHCTSHRKLTASVRLQK